jgi:hypothetical protein
MRARADISKNNFVGFSGLKKNSCRRAKEMWGMFSHFHFAADP